MNPMRALAIITILLTLAGCSGLIVANDGGRIVVEHDGFISHETASATAVKSCQQAGKGNATYIRSTNKNPSLPPGYGVQLSTFSCE